MLKKEQKLQQKTKAQVIVNENPWYNSNGFLAFFVALLTWIVYSKTGKFDFTNWDEKRYIFESPMVQSFTWNHVKLMFSNKVLNSYNPFVLMSLAFDYTLFGAKASGYHYHNLILHVINVLLVYAVIQELFKRKHISLFTTVIFAIHPLHTESVAWIASRKDVLYGVYFLASFYTYLKFKESKKSSLLILSLFLFLCSLFSKSQAVVLPVLFVLVDYFTDDDWKVKYLLNKIPYFVLALVFGYVTIAGSSASMTADEYGASFNFLERFMYSCHAFCLYLFKFFVPINQVAQYPFAQNNLNVPDTITYISLAIVPVFIGLCVYLFKKNFKLELLGLLFFTVCTAIVLHLIGTNSSLIYERFTYFSYLGLAISTASIIDRSGVYDKTPFKSIPLIVITAVFSILTFIRVDAWKNSEALWDDIIKKQPTISSAYNNRGNLFYQKADWNNALADFNKAIELNPKYPNSYSNRASVNIYLGKFEEALKDNEKALSINPHFPEAWLGKGVALYNMNKNEEAIKCYEKAISYIANFPNAYNNLGGAYLKLKNYDMAVKNFVRAIQLEPNYGEARINISIAYIEMKEWDKAEEWLLKTQNEARAAPTLSDLYLKKGYETYVSGDKQKAIELYLKSIAYQPTNAEAYYNLGGTYLMMNDLPKAREYWRKTLEVKPGHPEATKWLNQIGN